MVRTQTVPRVVALLLLCFVQLSVALRKPRGMKNGRTQVYCGHYIASYHVGNRYSIRPPPSAQLQLPLGAPSGSALTTAYLEITSSA